jgi:MFS family permease
VPADIQVGLVTSHVSRARRWQPWLVTALIVGFVIINWADKALLGLVAQPVMHEFGLTAAQFGLLGSAFSFLFSVTALIGGVVADRTSLRWVLFAMSALWALTSLPVLLASSFGALLVSRVALGAAEGPGTPLAHSAAYTWFPNERRGLPAALVTSGASIAKLVVAPILAVIIGIFGWKAGFVTLALAGGAWCVLWLFFGRLGPYAAPPRGSRAPAGDVAYTDGAQRGGPDRELADVGAARDQPTLLCVFTSRTFLGMLAGYFPNYAMVTVILTWLPSYFVKVWGLSPVVSGSLLGLPSIFAIACVFALGVLSDRLLRRGTTSRRARGTIGGVAVAVGGIALMLMPLFPEPGVGIALLLVGYGLGSALQAVCQPAVAEISGPRLRSTALGLFYAIGSVAGIIAPWLTGVILDQFDDPAAGYAAAFRVFGVGLTVGGLLCWWLVDPERDRRALGLESLSARAGVAA